jgi:pSer/pThr/pTyr-binding forkhead associated (FHA) protein
MDAKLIMFKPNGQRKDFSILNPTTVIGRAENCDLRVPILSVSRRHCELRLAGDQLSVKDLASSNGTYVNNQRVKEKPLGAGDRLVVGPIVFTVQVDGQPDEIKPVKTRGQRLAEAGTPGADEIVDLEADVAAKDESATGELAAAPEVAEETDPIAALEALAAEGDEEEEDK